MDQLRALLHRMACEAMGRDDRSSGMIPGLRLTVTEAQEARETQRQPVQQEKDDLTQLLDWIDRSLGERARERSGGL